MRISSKHIKTVAVVSAIGTSAAISWFTSDRSPATFFATTLLIDLAIGFLVMLVVVAFTFRAVHSTDPDRLPIEHRLFAQFARHMPPLLARLVTAEIAAIRAVWLALVRRPRPYHYAGRRFRYSAQPTLIFGLIGAVDLVVFLLIFFVAPAGPVKTAIDIIGVLGLLWFAGLFVCFAVYRHEVTDQHIRVRFATFTDVVIRHNGFSHIVADQSGDNVLLSVDGTTVTAPVMERTNITVTFTEPAKIVACLKPEYVGTTVTELRLWVDNPHDF